MNKFTVIEASNVADLGSVDSLLLVTHPGIFHADDVMTTALFEILFDSFECRVVRSTSDNFEKLFREYQEAYSETAIDNTNIGVIRYDIGCGDFDHHQEPELRENKIPYAAFGKVWRTFGPYKYPKDVVDSFDTDIATPIDAQDNGVSMNPLSQLISAFNPNWDEGQDSASRDCCFHNAVRIAKFLLHSYFKRIESTILAEEAGRDIISRNLSGNRHVLLMERFIPVTNLLYKEFFEIMLIVGPSSRNPDEWCIFTVKKGFRSPVDRQSLPEEWLDNPPEGCTFVHRNRFLASFKNKEDALKAALSIVEGGDEIE